MNWITSEGGIRTAGLMCFVLGAYTIWMGQMTVKELPGGYSNPVLALELVKEGKHIDEIKSAEGGRAVPFLTSQVYKDFGFILLYVIVFSCLGCLLANLRTPPSPLLGWLTASSVIVAGILDLLENRGMLKALKGVNGASDSLANSIRYPSLGKWALLFIFFLILGVMMWQHQGFLRVPALLFVLAAVSGLAGVIFNLVVPRHSFMFPAAILGLILALLSTAIIFTFFPQKVITTGPLG